MECVFCSGDKSRNLFETDNFFVKVGKGIITAGHVMIIPKHHYKAIGAIDNHLVNEYLDLKKLVTEKVSKVFYEPFLIEYGVFGQSVFHAHIHIIPKASSEYKEVDLFRDMILPTKTTTIEIDDFNELREYYDKNKEYVYFEDKKKYILPITDILINGKSECIVGYRHYFNRMGLKSVQNWKTMTEKDIELDNIKVKETKEKLIF